MQSKIHIKDNKYFPFKSGVYSLENKEGTVLYIGSAKHFTDALSRHLHYLKRGLYTLTNKSILQKEYDDDNLVFNILEHFNEISDEKLSKLEQKYIQLNKDSICNFQTTVKRHSSNGCKMDSFKRRQNVKGERNFNNKYPEKMVAEILWLKSHTNMKPVEIAKYYNVSGPYAANVGVIMWIYTEPKIPAWYIEEHALGAATIDLSIANNKIVVNANKPGYFTL